MGGTGTQEGNFSLETNCIIPNTTTVPVACGRNVTGSTVGLPSITGFSAGDKEHIFCPETTATARVSTCGSSFRTQFIVFGPDFEITKTHFDGACELEDTAVFNFKAGECYNIIVGGYSIEEGIYFLSIDCFSFKDVDCGSNISSSSVGLNGGAQHRFCSDKRGRLEASTCGSNFATKIQVNTTILDSDCADCAGDTYADCAGFNFRPASKDCKLVIVFHVGSKDSK